MNEFFIDRNISWLDFNQRVLDKANDSSIPLLERLSFLGITYSNLDEFISVKYSESYFKNKSNSNIEDEQGLTNYRERYTELRNRVIDFKKKQSETYNVLNHELSSNGIEIVDINLCSEEEIKETINYFNNSVYPSLTPIAQSVSKELPFFRDDEINLFVKGKNDCGDIVNCFIQIPKSLDRLVEISQNKYVLIEDIVSLNLKKLLKGNEIIDYIIFKVNKEYIEEIDHNTSKFIVDRMNDVLKKRDYSPCMFIDIYNKNYNNSDFNVKKYDNFVRELTKILSIPKLNNYISIYPIGLNFFKYKPIKESKLEYEKMNQRYSYHHFFNELKDDDLLLHHPYDSYSTVLDFIKEAALDDNVITIKQTLYRVSSDTSPVVDTLCEAAMNGKRVIVMLEILARFDESQNIGLINKLKQSGVNIIYSLDEYKTHCKMCLVVRRENKELITYAHVGTGNYNEKTANIYTDFSLFTSNKKICNGLIKVFNYLSGFSKIKTSTISVSPFTLRKTLESKIQQCIDSKVTNNKDSSIFIKVNSMADVKIMNKIKEAIEAGVNVNIICRGIYTFKDGIFNGYKNYSYKSIIGRFLEHSRMYVFSYDDTKDYYISSADLLTRNLDKRIELLIPIKSDSVKEKLDKIIDIISKDTVNSNTTNSNGEILDSHKELFK